MDSDSPVVYDFSYGRGGHSATGDEDGELSKYNSLLFDRRMRKKGRRRPLNLDPEVRTSTVKPKTSMEYEIEGQPRRKTMSSYARVTLSSRVSGRIIIIFLAHYHFRGSILTATEK